jgi:hypothetical protein
LKIAVSRQPSAISYQPSAISYQLSAVSYQLSAFGSCENRLVVATSVAAGGATAKAVTTNLCVSSTVSPHRDCTTPQKIAVSLISYLPTTDLAIFPGYGSPNRGCTGEDCGIYSLAE